MIRRSGRRTDRAAERRRGAAREARERERERRARRRARGESSADTCRGLWYGGVGLALIVGIGGAAWLLAPERHDPKTLCFDRPAPVRTMILIDRSDVLIGREATRTLIVQAAQALPIGGRLSIFEIGPAGTVTDALFDLCYPGRGDDVSELYRNPQLVEAFYLDQFAEPLTAVLARLDEPITAARSPIVESIAEVFRLSRRDPGAEAVRVIVVSDFLQFTEAFGDAYRGRFPVERAAEMLGLARQSQIVELEAVVMRRQRHIAEQDAARRAYWEPIFRSQRIFVDWK